MVASFWRRFQLLVSPSFAARNPSVRLGQLLSWASRTASVTLNAIFPSGHDALPALCAAVTDAISVFHDGWSFQVVLASIPPVSQRSTSLGVQEFAQPCVIRNVAPRMC